MMKELNNKNIERFGIARKLEAFGILIFPILYYFTSLIIVGIFLFLATFTFMFFDLLHYFSDGKNKLSKAFFKIYPKERWERRMILTEGTVFLLLVLIMLFIFPKEVFILTLIIFTFCDQSERLGMFVKSKGLPWSKEKNLAGTLTGVIFGFVFGYLSIILLKLNFSILSLIIASILAGFTGSMPESKKSILINDNIFIPIITALSLSFL